LEFEVTVAGFVEGVDGVDEFLCGGVVIVVGGGGVVFGICGCG